MIKEKTVWRQVVIGLVCLALILSVAIVGCAKPAPETVTLAFSTHAIPEMVQTEAVEKWAAAIAERTGGRVNFEIYPSQQLLTGKEIWDGISQGKVEAGHVTPSYFAGMHPVFNIADLPFLFSDYNHLFRAWDAGINDIIGDLFEKSNIHIISMGLWNYAGLGSNVRPIRLPQDLNGQKVDG